WQQLDVRDREAVDACVAAIRPDAIIHAAIAEPTEWATNADGTAHVALATREHGIRLVHVSSDAIFSGAPEPYDESAAPDPITPYGASKAAAETAVSAILPTAAIVRTSLIIGAEPYKHVRMVLDMLTGLRSDALFSDEIRCPVAVGDLAAALLELAHNDYAGVLNVAGADALSRYELGLLIARRWEYDPARLKAITTVESGLRRPTNVRLDIRRAQRLLQTKLRGATSFIASLEIEKS
ncbi:MAG TPA: sugar nucleotide-binding protein, partial [Herpetosiphonaceae bacterium]